MYNKQNGAFFFSFFFLKVYLFIYLTDRERERKHKQGEREREKQPAHQAGTPMWGSIPGSWDQDPSPRQMFNCLSHPGALFTRFCLLIF